MAKPPAAIPVVNADYGSTVAAQPTVEPVVVHRGAQALRLAILPKAVDKRRVSNFNDVTYVITVSSWHFVYFTA